MSTNNQTRHILTVKRTNKHIYCEIVDPKSGKIIDSASDLEMEKGSKMERSAFVGAKIAEVAKEHKIKMAVFNRNGYKYHGRVKKLAEEARAKGLEF